MDWLFARDVAGWPVHFIYVLESAFAAGFVAAFIAASAINNPGSGLKGFLIVIGVLVGALAISFPIMLAPLFFSIRGEWMMATIPAMIVVFPAALFVMYRVFKLV